VKKLRKVKYKKTEDSTPVSGFFHQWVVIDSQVFGIIEGGRGYMQQIPLGLIRFCIDHTSKNARNKYNNGNY